jgi:type IX secretion system PorP/SprF family membrane protein
MAGTASAQQDAMFTHYMNNTIAVNPAYAGTRNALTITGIHRSQWVGFDGAPITQTLTAHTPIANNKMGIGLSVVNDKIGPVTTTGAYADYAYYLKLDDKSKLSLGLSAGLNYMQAGLADLTIIDQDDEAFKENISSKLLPNFGFGMYYRRPRFYAGLSAPKLLQNNFYTNDVSGSARIAKEQRHYYFICGGVARMGANVEFRPTGFVKATPGAPVQADLTSTFIFNKRFLLGAMFRTGDAVGGLVGYYVTNQLHLGYSYDWSYKLETFKYNQGSHEIMLSYDFIYKNSDKIRSPRYF